jgi:hypothetical protein
MFDTTRRASGLQVLAARTSACAIPAATVTAAAAAAVKKKKMMTWCGTPFLPGCTHARQHPARQQAAAATAAADNNRSRPR